VPARQTIPAPTLITHPNQLEQLGRALAQESLIAVDTESNSLHAYQEQVCLIQFSVQRGDYLVDPITLQDLSPLAPVFSNSRIEKIFHAAEYDLICLQRDFNFQFANIFDTMVAARILGWKKYGLSAILGEHFGIRVNKKYQRSNWGRRPLTPEMLHYAQLDTHFLIPLRNQMKAALVEKNLWPLAKEDFLRACHVTAVPPVPKDELCFRVNGSHELSSQEMAVLQELCLYRDRVAARLDRPLFKVISNQILIDIAIKKPRSMDELGGVFGVRSWLLRNYGQGVISAVQRGLTTEPPKPPKRPRHSHDFVERLEALRNWRKHKARKMGVESDVILPRDVMEHIVQANPRSMKALSRAMALLPWREKRFGAEILEVLKEVN
jgi:ribonuclease D